MRGKFACLMVILLSIVTLGFTGCTGGSSNFSFRLSTNEVNIIMGEADESGEVNTQYVTADIENNNSNSSLLFRIENEGVIACEITERLSYRVTFKITALNPGTAKLVVFNADSSNMSDEIIVRVYKHIENVEFVDGFAMYVVKGSTQSIDFDNDLEITPQMSAMEDLRFSIVGEARGLKIGETTGIVDATEAEVGAVTIQVSSAYNPDQTSTAVVNIVEPIEVDEINVVQSGAVNADIMSGGSLLVDNVTLVKTKEDYAYTTLTVTALMHEVGDLTINATTQGRVVQIQQVADNVFIIKALELGDTTITLSFIQNGAEKYLEPVSVDIPFQVIDAPSQINLNGVMVDGSTSVNIYNNYEDTYLGASLRFTLSPTSVLEEHSRIILSLKNLIGLQQLAFFNSKYEPLTMTSEGITITAGDTIYVRADNVEPGEVYTLIALAENTMNYGEPDTWLSVEIELNVLQGITDMYFETSPVIIRKGETKTVSVNVSPVNADVSTLTTSGSNEYFDVVDNGNATYDITAKKTGSSYFTVYRGNGSPITTLVEVYEPLTEMTLETDESYQNVNIGSKEYYDNGELYKVYVALHSTIDLYINYNSGATITDLEIYVDGVLSSNNSTRLTVSKEGESLVRVIIYGYDPETDGTIYSIEKTIRVVGYRPISSISLNILNGVRYNYETVGFYNQTLLSQYTLQALVYPQNATYASDVVWTITDKSNDGLLSGSLSTLSGPSTIFTAGPFESLSDTIIITASVTEFGRSFSQTCTIEVRNATMVDNIVLNNVSNNLLTFDSRKGLGTTDNSFTVSASAYPVNAQNRNLRYSYVHIDDSSSTPIFSVNASGQVIPIRAGTGLLRISAEDSFINATESSRYVDVVVKVLDGQSIENAFHISTPEELMDIGSSVHTMSLYYVLTADIDLKDIDWNPIGTNNKTAFTGYLSGKFEVPELGISTQYSIDNLTINKSLSQNIESYYGLFYRISSNDYMQYSKYEGAPVVGRVEDLSISVNINVDCSDIEQLRNNAEFNVYVGALAGSYVVHNSYNQALLNGSLTERYGIKNVSIINNGFTYSAGKNNAYIGGLVGYSNGLIEYTTKAIGFSGQTIVINDRIEYPTLGTSDTHIYHPKYSLGGLVGENAGVVKGIYTNEINTDNEIEYLTLFESEGVTVTADICGNIGLVNNKDNIKSINSKVGGVVGVSRGILEGLASENTVNGLNNVGGIVGYNTGIIKNCLSASKVNGNENVGGLAGYSSGSVVRSVFEVYETTSLTANDIAVSGFKYVGGLIGYLEDANLQYCYTMSYVTEIDGYYDITVNGDGENIGGLVGYATGSGITQCYSNLNINASEVQDNGVVGTLVGNGSGYSVSYSNTNNIIATYSNAGITAIPGYANGGNITNSYFYVGEGYSINGNTSANSIADVLNAIDSALVYFLSDGNLRYIGTASDTEGVLSQYPLVPKLPTSITAKIKDSNNILSHQVEVNGVKEDVLILQFYDAINPNDQSKLTLSNQVTIGDYLDVSVSPNEGRTTRINVVSGNENVLRVSSDGTLRILSTGYVSLTLSNKVKESVRTVVHIYIVNSITDFTLYSSINTDEGADDLNGTPNNPKLLRLKKDSNQIIVPVFSGYTTSNDGTEIIATKVDENIGVRYTYTKDNGYYNYDVAGATMGDDYIDIDQRFQTILKALAKTNENIVITATPYVYLTNIGGTVLNNEKVLLDELSATFELQVYVGATNMEFDGSVEAEIYSGTTTEVAVVVTTDNYEDVPSLTITDSTNTVVYAQNIKGDTFDVEGLTPTVYYMTVGSSEWILEDLNDTTLAEFYADKDLYAKKFVYNVSLTLPSKFISQNTSYTLSFGVQSNNQLGLEYPITFMPESIHDMYVQTYAYGEVDYFTGQYNPSEESALTIVPGVNGLIEIDINPIYSDYDTILIQSDDIRFEQLIKKNITNSNEYPYVLPGDRLYLTDGITMVKQYFDSNNNIVWGTNGKYYASMALKDSAEDGEEFEIRITVVKNTSSGQQILQQTTLTLVAQNPPGVSINIDGQDGMVADLYLPVGTQNDMNVSLKDFDGANIEWTYTNLDTGMPYTGLEVVQNGDSYSLNISRNALSGDYVEITASATKSIGGATRTTSDSIRVIMVDYVIRDIGFEGVYNSELREVFGGEYPLSLSFENSMFYYDTTNPAIEQAIRDQLARLSSTDYNTWYAYRSGTNGVDVAITNYYSNNYYRAYTLSETDKQLYVTGNYYDDLISNQKRISATLMYYFDRTQRSYVFARNGMENIATRTEDTIHDLYTGSRILNGRVYNVINRVFDLSFYLSTSRENAIPVYNANDLLNMEDDCNYILMNNIVVDSFSPIQADIASLNGNNYTITLRSYIDDTENRAGEKNIGLFETISENCIIENLKLVIDTSKLYIDAEGYDTVTFGTLAAVNEGKIYNCSVEYITSSTPSSAIVDTVISGRQVNMSYDYSTMAVLSNDGEDSTGSMVSANARGIVVQTTLTQIDGAFVTTVIGGLVGDNSGYIVNCTTDVAIHGYGTMGGMVGINNNTIASSKVLGTLNSYTLVNSLSNIGGFVGINNGRINLCYVEGDYNLSSGNAGSVPVEINASCYVGGFVCLNSESGVINNAYANIKIISQDTTAGFVYNNQGSISNAYSTSIVRENSLKAMAFVGVDDLNNINNSGTLDYCYFLRGNYTNQTLQPVNMIDNASDFTDVNTFTNFAFDVNTDGTLIKDSTSSVWSIQNGKPTINSANRVVKGYVTLISQGGENGQIVYNYSALKGATLGSADHPYVIYTPEDFNNFISEVGTNNNKYYVLASDITFEETSMMATTYKVNFHGVFEGNGMVIYNLRLSTKYQDFANANSMGIFASISGRETSSGELERAIVRNLDIYLGEVYGTNLYTTGALAGTIQNAMINNINIYSNGDETVMVQGRNATGVIAGVIKNSIVSDIYIDAGANAGYRQDVASLYLDASTDVSNDYPKPIESGRLASVSYAGALAGIITGDSYVKGVTLGENAKVVADLAGGAVGLIDKEVTCEYITAEVTANNSIKYTTIAGGLVAENRGTLNGAVLTYPDEVMATEQEGVLNETANNNYFNPTITDDDIIISKGITVGGLVGFNNGGNIYNSYTNVSIVGKVLVAGGLVGRSMSGNIESCYSASSIDVGITGINSDSENTYVYTIVGGLIGLVSDGAYNIFDNSEGIIDRFVDDSTKKLKLNNVMAVNNWLISRNYYNPVRTNENGGYYLNFIQGGLIGVVSDESYVTSTFSSYNYYNNGIYAVNSPSVGSERYILTETGFVGGLSKEGSQEFDYFPERLAVYDNKINISADKTRLELNKSNPMERMLMISEGEKVVDEETGTVTYVPFETANGILYGERSYVAAMFIYTSFEFTDMDAKYPTLVGVPDNVLKLENLAPTNDNGQMQISTDRQLKRVRDLINTSTFSNDVYSTNIAGENYLKSGGMNLVLANSIALTEENFTPIGSNTNPFVGTFDGDGYVINNLRTSNHAYTGFFGVIKDSTITDLGLAEDCVIRATNSNVVTGMIGKAVGDCTISKVYSRATYEVSTSGTFAALIGASENNPNEKNTLRIENSYTNFEFVSSYNGETTMNGLLGNSKVNTIINNVYTVATLNYSSNANIQSDYNGFVGTSNNVYLYSSWMRATAVSGKNKSIDVNVLGDVNYPNKVYYYVDSVPYVQQIMSQGARSISNTIEFMSQSFYMIENNWNNSYLWDFSNTWIIEEEYHTYPVLGESEYDSNYYEGIGRYDPYTGWYYIEKEEHIQNLAKLINDGTIRSGASGLTFVLFNDLKVSLSEPIGDYANAFRGTFYGFGHTLTVTWDNTTVNADSTTAYGLFGRMENAILNNLNIKYTNGITLNMSNGATGYLGGVAGLARYGMIDRVTVDMPNTFTLNASNSYSYLGGIVGQTDNEQITRCYVTANLAGSDTDSDYQLRMGGLAGYVKSQNISIVNNMVNIDAQINSVVNNISDTYSGLLFGQIRRVDYVSMIEYNYYDREADSNVINATNQGSLSGTNRTSSGVGNFTYNNSSIWDINNYSWLEGSEDDELKFEIQSITFDMYNLYSEEDPKSTTEVDKLINSASCRVDYTGSALIAPTFEVVYSTPDPDNSESNQDYVYKANTLLNYYVVDKTKETKDGITYAKNLAGEGIYVLSVDTSMVTIEIPDIIELSFGTYDEVSLKKDSFTNGSMGSDTSKINNYARTIILGRSVVDIPTGESNPFQYVSNLSTLRVSSNNSYYSSAINGINYNMIYSLRDSTTLIAGCANTTIPEGVRKIADYAFANSNIGEINFPSSLTQIGNYAFYNCAQLTNINKDDQCNLTSIGNSAFEGCSSLTSFDLGQDLESIGSYAFANTTQITAFVIPASVESIGANAFLGSAWQNSQTTNSTTPYYILNNWIVGTNASNAAATKEKLDLSSLNIIGIADQGLANLSQVTEIIFPAGSSNGIKYIGEGVLLGANSLKSLTIPYLGSTPRLGDNIGYVFGNTDFIWAGVPASLKYINVLEGTIVESAFEGLTINTLNTGDASIEHGALFGITFTSMDEAKPSLTMMMDNSNDYLGNAFGLEEGESMDFTIFASITLTGTLRSGAIIREYIMTGVELNIIATISNGAIVNETINDLSITVNDDCHINQGAISNSIINNVEINDSSSNHNSTKIAEGAFDNVTFDNVTLPYLGGSLNATNATFNYFTETSNLSNSIVHILNGNITANAFSGWYIEELIVDYGVTLSAQCYNDLDVIKLTTPVIDENTTLATLFEGGNVSPYLNFLTFADGSYIVNNYFLGDDKEVKAVGCNIIGLEVPSTVSYSGDELLYIPSLSKIVYVKDTNSKALNRYTNKAGATIITTDTGELPVQRVDKYLVYKKDGKNYLIGAYGKHTDLSDCAQVLKANGIEKITGVYKFAFKLNEELTAITLPEEITTVDYMAFDGCRELTTINADTTFKVPLIKGIGDYGFSSTYVLSNVDLSELTSIGKYAFYYSGIVQANIINVDQIPHGAFEHAEDLMIVTFSENLTSIGAYAFSYCTFLTNTIFPDTLESIGAYAFSDCTTLTEVDLSNTKLTTMSDSVFSGCTSLEEIKLPSTITTIDNYAFYNCAKLKPIALNGITSLGDGAFGGNQLIETVHIPSSITINGNPYQYCTNLSSITEDNTRYRVEGSCLIRESDNVLIIGTTSAQYLPTSINKIGQSAFRGIPLTTIEVPHTVSEIQSYAFYDTGLIRFYHHYEDNEFITYGENVFKDLKYAFLDNYVDLTNDGSFSADAVKGYLDILKASKSGLTLENTYTEIGKRGDELYDDVLNDANRSETDLGYDITKYSGVVDGDTIDCYRIRWYNYNQDRVMYEASVYYSSKYLDDRY